MRKSLKTAGALALTVGVSLASTLAAPAPASAQGYYDYSRDACRHEKSNNTTAGAVIGGLGGAIIGNSVAGRGDRTAGTVVGGALGAAVGAGVGSSTTDCNDDRRGYDYRRYDYDRDRYDTNRGYYDRDGEWRANPYPYGRDAYDYGE
jgi:uncharacterized protein YcfJ